MGNSDLYMEPIQEDYLSHETDSHPAIFPSPHYHHLQKLCLILNTLTSLI